jgi:membrane protease YdiL (CAAX protease family)
VGLVKKWYLYLGIILAAINLALLLNEIQDILIHYPTSASLGSFLGIYLVEAVINLIIISVAFILPGIAGETLREESLPQQPYGSFLHYLRSTFLSRPVSRAILFGYVLFFIMLGLQAGLFYLGQKYLGVWKEWLRLAQFSSAYIPLFSAFAVGISASLNEEVIFRLFGISWAKAYLKHIFLATIFSAFIWGFGHTTYAIFPIWFRGIEVSIMGLLYGFIFIKYGIIPLIVAHYLFDVFWGIAAYILGKAHISLFAGSIFLLALPLALAVFCYLVNQEEKEKEIKICLNKIQRYNLDILLTFVASKKSQGRTAAGIREELLAHNWDALLIDLAIAEVFKP